MRNCFTDTLRPFALRAQRIAGEFGFEGLEAQVLQQGVAFGGRLQPEHRAEAPRIGEAHRVAARRGRCRHGHASRRRGARHPREPAGHSEVDEEVPRSRSKRRYFARRRTFSQALAPRGARQVAGTGQRSRGSPRRHPRCAGLPREGASRGASSRLGSCRAWMGSWVTTFLRRLTGRLRAGRGVHKTTIETMTSA